MFQGNDRGDEFIVAENPLEGLDIEHPPVGVVLVFEEKDTSAFRTGIEEFLDIELLSALETAVVQIPFRFGNEIGADVGRKLIWFHGFFLSMHSHFDSGPLYLPHFSRANEKIFQERKETGRTKVLTGWQRCNIKEALYPRTYKIFPHLQNADVEGGG